jgi:hypothetical protein
MKQIRSVTLRRHWRAILTRFVCPESDLQPDPITLAEILCGYEPLSTTLVWTSDLRQCGMEISFCAGKSPEGVTNEPADRRNKPTFCHGTYGMSSSPKRTRRQVRAAQDMLMAAIGIIVFLLLIGLAKLLG